MSARETNGERAATKAPAQDAIDLAALAEKVYRLLREELRLELARSGASNTRRKA